MTKSCTRVRADANTYPVLLDTLPAPTVRAYSRYSVVAEKLHIIVVRGVTNSRLKDYFDLWTIAMHSEIEGSLLVRAIAATFTRRETALTENIPAGLGEELLAGSRKQNEWRAFLSKNKLTALDLTEVITLLRAFLLPVIESARRNTDFTSSWRSGGPWQ